MRFLETTPELATVVLAFGIDWIVYRVFLHERLTWNRFLSAVTGGLLSSIAWTFLSPLTASWKPDAILGAGLALILLAAVKNR